jgi:ABC-2 type transport system ATP-binding protein
MEILLEARQLSRRYGAEIAVDGVDLSLARGEVLGFLGANGAGKSTCLALLTGNLRPHGGSVRILGRDLWAEPLAAKAAIGYLPEQPPLYPDLRVDEYLAYAGRLHRLRGRVLTAAIARVKTACDLTALGRRLIGNLSKGMRQRVGLAQALIHDPPLVLLDEPTVGLDPLQLRGVRELLRALGRERGVLLSSHLLAEVQAVCTRVLILDRGRVVYQGATDAANALHLRLTRPPELAAWQALPAVAQVWPLGERAFRVEPAPGAGPADLAAQVVAAGWGLELLQPDPGGLEQAFLRAVAGAPVP